MNLIARTWPRNGLRLTLYLAVFLGLLASRRWEQLASPQVWDEDGGFISGFIADGWRELLQPVNGYLILVPKLICGSSLALSLYCYPLVSTVLAWLFIALVGLAVAVAPTRLGGKFLCAVCIFLIPSGPEAFGLPLYTFWWAFILLLLVALWDERRPLLGVRLAFLAAGGLSSPFVLVILPVLFFRAAWYRSRAELATASFGTGLGAIQLYFVAAGAPKAVLSLASMARNVIPRFCGWFLWGNLSDRGPLLWGGGLLVIAAFTAFALKGRRNPTTWILLFLYAGAIGASVYRIDPSVLHPVLAGPRYFFLPFILTFWILIQLFLAAEFGWLRALAAIAILTAVTNALPVRTRPHDDLRWAEHVRSARRFPVYEIPIEYDGHRSSAWSIREPGPTWDRLIRRDRLVAPGRLAALPTFAYRVLRANEATGEPPLAAPPTEDPRGSGPVISSGQAGSGRKEVRLAFGAGRRIRFRSGPVKSGPSMRVLGCEGAYLPSLPITADWVTLEFSNSGLPREFTIEVEDEGEGTGEWAAF